MLGKTPRETVAFSFAHFYKAVARMRTLVMNWTYWRITLSG